MVSSNTDSVVVPLTVGVSRTTNVGPWQKKNGLGHIHNSCHLVWNMPMFELSLNFGQTHRFTRWKPPLWLVKMYIMVLQVEITGKIYHQGTMHVGTCWDFHFEPKWWIVRPHRPSDCWLWQNDCSSCRTGKGTEEMVNLVNMMNKETSVSGTTCTLQRTRGK